MEAHPRDNIVMQYNVLFGVTKIPMMFWNQSTFVTYSWNGQERKV